MNEYGPNLLDPGLVALTIVSTQLVKGRVAKRWIPLIPWFFAMLYCAAAIIGASGGWPGTLPFLARWALEVAKVAFAAMGLFKLYHTTLMGG